MASNMLRGGKNIYGAQCLQGNWAEERHEPGQQVATTMKAQQLPPSTAKTWSQTSSMYGEDKKEEMAKVTQTTVNDSWMSYQKADPDMYVTTSHGHFHAPNDRSVVAQFRKAVLKHGGAAALHTLNRLFIRLDQNRDRELSLEEMEKGLRQFGMVNLKKQDLQQMLQVLDRNLNGTISFNEFVAGVRGQISERREELIAMAFRVLDKTGDGVVTMEDVSEAYNVDFDPDVLAGRTKPDAAVSMFLSQFDTAEKDGIVTQEEFLEHYRSVSASIPDDEYFELMIRNAWHIPGGEGWCENTANLRVLVYFVDGRQEVVMVENDLGLDPKDKKAIRKRLDQQGVKGISEIQTSTAA
jgi:Ca2+-binding EF-hand superfamily protein